MNYDEILRTDEKYAFFLRALFEQNGYSQYKMSKFEEYDLYLANKNFLQNETIITFTSPRGQLMALKPDITLSIVKNFAESGEIGEKVYYNENVYRASAEGDLQEQIQIGVENIGKIDIASISEMLELAAEGLEKISDDYIIGISHLKIVTELLDKTELSDSARAKITKCLSHKNAHEIQRICSENEVDENITEKIVMLSGIYGSFETMLPKIKTIADCEAVNELSQVYNKLKTDGKADKVRIDFSIMSDLDYYNGIIFQGYVSEVPFVVLSGGRYDNLLRKFHKKTDAIGFAIYLDKLEQYFGTNKE